MITSGVDLLSNVRKSLADLAELYVMLDDGLFDAVQEARLGFRESSSVSATGLAASRLSSKIYFGLPQEVGPENITISMDDEDNFVLQFDDDFEWLAMQLFLNVDVSIPRRLCIQSRYGDPGQGRAPPFPIEYFFRVYNPELDPLSRHPRRARPHSDARGSLSRPQVQTER